MEHKGLALKKTGLIFENLNESSKQEAVELVTKSFLTNNEIWNHLNIPKEEGLAVISERIEFAVGQPYSYIMKCPETSTVAMIVTAIDIVDYLSHKPVHGVSSPWLNAIKEVAQDLEGDYFSALSCSRNQIIYGDTAATNMKFANKHLTFLFWGMILKQYKRHGFKTLFCRASNPKSRKLLENFGGQTIKSCFLKAKEVQGFKMDLMELDLGEISFEKFDSMISE